MDRRDADAADTSGELLYHEDIEPGATYEAGGYEVSREELVGFAERYDPQWFHTDPEGAADSIYGGVIASGWHTAAIGMHLLVEAFLRRVAAAGSPGVDDLRWPAPVHPGDTLDQHIEVLETRPLESRPGLGVVRIRWTMTNQDDATVLTARNPMFVERRGDD